MGVVDEMHQRHQVGHAPGTGLQAGCFQFDRMVPRVVLDIGIHPIRVTLKVGARGRVQLERVAVAVAAHAQHPHADVAGQRVGAEGGGQLATPRGPEQFHLQEPVLCGDEALGLQQVRRVGGRDVGHAQLVADHFDRRGEPGQLQVAVNLRVPGRSHHQIAAHGSHDDECQQTEHHPFQGLAHRESSPVVMNGPLKGPASAPL